MFRAHSLIIILTAANFVLSALCFESIDINTPVPGKTQSVGVDGFDIESTGADIWYAEDNCRLAYRICAGDFDVRTRLVSMQNTHEWAKAGLMARRSTEPGSANVILFLAPSHGVNLQGRKHDKEKMDGYGSRPSSSSNVWLRLARSGNDITGYTSTDGGKTWEGIATMQFSDAELLVGLVVCSHDSGVACKAEFRDVSFDVAGGSASPRRSAFSSAQTELVNAPSAPAPALPKAVATPEDKETARAYASSANKLLTDGKPEKARDILFTALAADEDCPEALLELGKLFEKDGNSVAAADFIVRAGREFGKQEGSRPEAASRRLECERRVLKLNPFATRFSAILTDYTAELNTITAKLTDTLTIEQACDHADMLNLRTVVPPDKGPKFQRPTAVAAITPKQPSRGDPEYPLRSRPKETVTNVPPDVERALKAAGWSTITGTWTKKGESVYEVTDGKLQSDYTNGALQVIVQKGGTGKVKAAVRNAYEDYSGSFAEYGSGFGAVFKGGTCKLYTTTSGNNFANSQARPMFDHDISLPPALPKSIIQVTVNEGNLEIILNGKKEHRSNYKIAKEGPFVIEVDGTMTIEQPMARGN